MNKGLRGFPLGKQLDSGLLGYPLGAVPIEPASAFLNRDVAGSNGVMVTAGASNSKGSWTTLSESVPFDADGFWVDFSETAAARATFVFDFAVGVPGEARLMLLQGLVLGTTSSNLCGERVYVPASLRAGEALFARSQCSSGAVAARLTATTVAGPPYARVMPPLSQSEAPGLLLSGQTNGTTLDNSSVSAHTKTSWVTLTSATSFDARFAYLCFFTRTNFGASNVRWLLDLGFGPADSEVVVIENAYSYEHQVEDRYAPGVFGPFACDIPAGSRIAVRGQGNIAHQPMVSAVLLG